MDLELRYQATLCVIIYDQMNESGISFDYELSSSQSVKHCLNYFLNTWPREKQPVAKFPFMNNSSMYKGHVKRHQIDLVASN